MSELLRQYEHSVAVKSRLWNSGNVRREVKTPPPRPVSPFIRAKTVMQDALSMSRLRRLFPLPIVEIDDDGNEIFANGPKPLWKCIAEEVCARHGVTMTEMISHRRAMRVVPARFEAIWRCHKETPMSLPQIGKHFDRDHTSVLYAIRRHQEIVDAAKVLNERLMDRANADGSSVEVNA